MAGGCRLVEERGALVLALVGGEGDDAGVALATLPTERREELEDGGDGAPGLAPAAMGPQALSQEEAAAYGEDARRYCLLSAQRKALGWGARPPGGWGGGGGFEGRRHGEVSGDMRGPPRSPPRACQSRQQIDTKCGPQVDPSPKKTTPRIVPKSNPMPTPSRPRVAPKPTPSHMRWAASRVEHVE